MVHLAAYYWTFVFLKVFSLLLQIATVYFFPLQWEFSKLCYLEGDC